MFRGGGWGKNLVKAVFMSVYRRLAANPIQNHVKKRGGVPKPFRQDWYGTNPAISSSQLTGRAKLYPGGRRLKIWLTVFSFLLVACL